MVRTLHFESRRRNLARRWVVLFVACVLGPAPPALAYGVLAHEAIIDSVWESSIAPLLRARFHPSADRLVRARAFAYGGAIIQDSGYYPFSSRSFGDFTHYVRSGEFIAALIREASTVDEYAFALGALAHYAADTGGHPLAINRAVPLIYPKLAGKYGVTMTYADNPSAHIRTEFGFDVVQVARAAYAPQAYHDFIGFDVSTPVLERAFRSTYGVELTEVFGRCSPRSAAARSRSRTETSTPGNPQGPANIAWPTRPTPTGCDDCPIATSQGSPRACAPASWPSMVRSTRPISRCHRTNISGAPS